MTLFGNLCLLGILTARALLQLLLPPWKRARARASERASERESTRARASERVSERAKERESLEKFSKDSGLSYLSTSKNPYLSCGGKRDLL